MRWPKWAITFWLWLMRVEPTYTTYQAPAVTGSRDRALHGKARVKARRSHG